MQFSCCRAFPPKTCHVITCTNGTPVVRALSWCITGLQVFYITSLAACYNIPCSWKLYTCTCIRVEICYTDIFSNSYILPSLKYAKYDVLASYLNAYFCSCSTRHPGKRTQQPRWHQRESCRNGQLCDVFTTYHQVGGALGVATLPGFSHFFLENQAKSRKSGQLFPT